MACWSQLWCARVYCFDEVEEMCQLHLRHQSRKEGPKYCLHRRPAGQQSASTGTHIVDHAVTFAEPALEHRLEVFVSYEQFLSCVDSLPLRSPFASPSALREDEFDVRVNFGKRLLFGTDQDSLGSPSILPTADTRSFGTTRFTPPPAAAPPATPPPAPAPPAHALSPPPLPTVLAPTVVTAAIGEVAGSPIPSQ